MTRYSLDAKLTGGMSFLEVETATGEEVIVEYVDNLAEKTFLFPEQVATVASLVGGIAGGEVVPGEAGGELV